LACSIYFRRRAWPPETSPIMKPKVADNIIHMYNASLYTVNGAAAQNTEYTIDGQPDNSVPW